MQVRQLGNGPTVSVLGLGCNNFGMKIDAEQTNEVVGAALDAGITHFDTAEMYGDGLSEEFLGRALGSRRDEVVVATKFLPRPAEEPYTPGALAARIRSGCEQSLRRLGTDRIDLYYQHYPDPQAPAEEALETLASLVAEGKVVHIASSNVTAEQIVSDQQTAAQRDLPAFCGTQIEWNLLNRQVEESIVPAAVSAGMGVVPYYPLASVLLTGKYHRGQAFPKGSRFDELPFFSQVATDDNLARVDRLAAFADDRGHTLLELAFAWLLAQAPVGRLGDRRCHLRRAGRHECGQHDLEADRGRSAAVGVPELTARPGSTGHSDPHPWSALRHGQPAGAITETHRELW